MTFNDIIAIIGDKTGIFDAPCPECGPYRRAKANQVRPVLRIWREKDDFARYHCVRCGLSGYAHDEADENKSATSCGTVVPPAVAVEDKDDDQRTERALALWREARPFKGTLAEAYLASRGLTYHGDALRFHPSCPFGQGRREACMIGLVRNIRTNEPQAIHRTAIDRNARKIGRKSFGPVAGGAIKLSDDAEVTAAVAIGEGIESTLSIQHLPGLRTMPVWSLLSAGGVASFPALSGIESVWIAADNDEGGKGQGAALEAAERLDGARIEVIVLTTTIPDTDLNDWRAA